MAHPRNELSLVMPDTQERPKPNQGIVAEHGGWNEVYQKLPPGQLPWNAGGSDPDLVRLVGSKRIPAGRAVDVGTGPGHDAIYLAKHGFRGLAIDIAPAALDLSRANAEKAGVAKAMEFRGGNILDLSSPSSSASFMHDHDCFHFLAPGDWNKYIHRIHDVLAPEGYLLLRTFSDKEPDGPGPHRFSQRELESLFSLSFSFLEIKEGVFKGLSKPKAYLCLLQKSGEKLWEG